MESVGFWIAGYFVLLLVIAFFIGKKESVKDYYINNKKTGLWSLVFSHVATFMGSAATLVVVAQAYSGGISYGLGLMLSFIFGFLVWAFLSYHIKNYCDRNNIFLISDFIGERFGKKSRVITEIIQVFVLVIAISAQSIAMGYLTSQLLGVSFLIGLVISGAITLVYTFVGGLKMDIISDTIQSVIFIFLFVVMAIITFFRVDFSMLSSLPSSYYNPIAFGGMGWFLGLAFFGGFFLLGLNHHWLRVVSAKDAKTARKSFLIAIFFVVLVFAAMILFGLASKTFIDSPDANKVFFIYMSEILPSWLMGLGYVALLSILMSSIDSFILGGSSIITKRFSERSSVMLARYITFLFGLIGFLVAYYWTNIISIAYLAICLSIIFAPVILAGLFTKYVSSKAVFIAISITSLITILLYPMLLQKTFIYSFIISSLITFGFDPLFRWARKN